MSKPMVSVIIPVRNQADKIEQCLKAVFSQSHKPCEVIVVDGHSTDGSTQKAEKYPIDLIYESYHLRARARSGACQVGVEHARGDYIAFTDADCIPDKDWLLNLLEAFHEQVVGVGGKVINIGDTDWENSINLALGTFIGSAGSLQGKPPKEERLVKSISGCNSIYKKRSIIGVGGFNPNLPGAEDLELNRRLLKLGNLLYTPKAIVYHNHNWTSEGDGGKAFRFAKKMYRYGKDRGQVGIIGFQFLPLLVLFLLVFSFFYTSWIIAISTLFYILAILATSLKVSIAMHNVKFIAMLPVIYIIEHSAYSVGLFWGLIKRIKKQ
jgi:glycosyltransferase involved in cell wall biosynthesis